jgi:hypothetical protein
MSRSNVENNVTGFGQFVNVAITALALAVLGAGYFAAIGQFAGIA